MLVFGGSTLAMRIQVEPDRETQRRIIEAAVRERRSVPNQAEILLRRAVGLPDPVYTPSTPAQPQKEAERVSAA